MSTFRPLLLTALAPTALSAQVIGGRVVDSASHRPLAAVVVAALEAGRDSAIATTRTDTSGVFYLELRRPGAYNLRFEVVPTSLTLRDTFVVSADDFLERQFELALPADPEFLASQVDKRARVKPGNLGLRYPEERYKTGTSGSVLVMYVVDGAGQIERESIAILKSTDRAFTSAVMRSLLRLSFEPAEFRGKAVRQVVQQPFYFCIGTCRGPQESNPYGVIVTAGPMVLESSKTRRP